MTAQHKSCEGAGGEVLLDQRVRVFGSHQQKLVVVRRRDDPSRDVAAPRYRFAVDPDGRPRRLKRTTQLRRRARGTWSDGYR